MNRSHYKRWSRVNVEVSLGIIPAHGGCSSEQHLNSSKNGTCLSDIIPSGHAHTLYATIGKFSKIDRMWYMRYARVPS
jgi:hypothetical protein